MNDAYLPRSHAERTDRSTIELEHRASKWHILPIIYNIIEIILNKVYQRHLVRRAFHQDLLYCGKNGSIETRFKIRECKYSKHSRNSTGVSRLKQNYASVGARCCDCSRRVAHCRFSFLSNILTPIPYTVICMY
jgi:hypothetical protein